MNQSDVGHLVSRFLGWKLPQDFNPDCGISFKRHGDYEHPVMGVHRYEPIGTNLFTAEQARVMFEHCLEGLTHPQPQITRERLLAALKEAWRQGMQESADECLGNANIHRADLEAILAELSISTPEGTVLCKDEPIYLIAASKIKSDGRWLQVTANAFNIYIGSKHILYAPVDQGVGR
jgi:hypothetical protein